jgi:hypothetical protein
MKNLAQNFGVAACGLITSVLTALADVSIAKMTGIDVFTFSIWVVIPAGAIGVGLAAASGYYFGSLYFHKRADISLVVQMVLIAGLTQLLIYDLGYFTMVLDDGRRVHDFVAFDKYLDIKLTTAHYRIGRGTGTDTGEVGSLGYWIAALQFVGFLVGGLAVWALLRAKPVCSKCNLYLRPLFKKQKSFSNVEAAAPYYDVLFKHPVDGSEFAELIRSNAVAKVAKGVLQIKTALLGCIKCKAQLVDERVQIYNGRDWKDLDKLHRRVRIPEGVDLRSVFAK